VASKEGTHHVAMSIRPFTAPPLRARRAPGWCRRSIPDAV